MNSSNNYNYPDQQAQGANQQPADNQFSQYDYAQPNNMNAGYDQYGNLMQQPEAAGYDQYGNALPADMGMSGYDQYGNPMQQPVVPGYDQYGNPLPADMRMSGYDQYGNPMQQPAATGYDQYGNPLPADMLMPGYDQYGNPMQQSFESGYDQYGNPIPQPIEPTTSFAGDLDSYQPSNLNNGNFSNEYSEPESFEEENFSSQKKGSSEPKKIVLDNKDQVIDLPINVIGDALAPRFDVSKKRLENLEEVNNKVINQLDSIMSGIKNINEENYKNVAKLTENFQKKLDDLAGKIDTIPKKSDEQISSLKKQINSLPDIETVNKKLESQIDDLKNLTKQIEVSAGQNSKTAPIIEERINDAIRRMSELTAQAQQNIQQNRIFQKMQNEFMQHPMMPPYMQMPSPYGGNYNYYQPPMLPPSQNVEQPSLFEKLMLANMFKSNFNSAATPQNFYGPQFQLPGSVSPRQFVEGIPHMPYVPSYYPAENGYNARNDFDYQVEELQPSFRRRGVNANNY